MELSDSFTASTGEQKNRMNAGSLIFGGTFLIINRNSNKNRN